MSRKYQIIKPDDVIYKDDGKKLVLLYKDSQNEDYAQIYCSYERFINTTLTDVLLEADYTKKELVQEDIRSRIAEVYDNGAAADLSATVLKSLYVADLQTGKPLFNNIADIDTVIQWKGQTTLTPASHNPNNLLYGKKGLIIGVAGIVIGILIAGLALLIVGRLNHSENVATSSFGLNSPGHKTEAAKAKINAVYDPKYCAVYFNDTTFPTIDYYIDYQKKIKKIEDINWTLQSNSVSTKDTLFLKDDCTIYLRGEKGEEVSEVRAIDVSYLDFITELLVTRDPLIKEMLVTNSPTPFGNTTFMVDGVPQQASYYKSTELIDYIKKGYRVASIKAMGSNLNPTNKKYPKLAKITIQKE